MCVYTLHGVSSLGTSGDTDCIESQKDKFRDVVLGFPGNANIRDVS